MRLGIFILAGILVFAGTVQAEANEKKAFGNWTVEIKIDEFDKKVKPTLKADIHSRDGEHTGVLSLNLIINRGQCTTASVWFNGPRGGPFQGLNSSFPHCDYEFVRYRIDEGETN